MSLRQEFVNGINTLFKELGDLKTTVTITEQTDGSYDAVTGQPTRTTTPHIVQAAVTKPSRRMLDNPKVLATDKQIIWNPEDVPGFEPQIDMIVTIGANEHSMIVIDPVGPADGGPALAWIMIVRRTSARAA